MPRSVAATLLALSAWLGAAVSLGDDGHQAWEAIARERAAIDARWSRALEQLAGKCRQLGREDLAARTLQWRLPPTGKAERIFLPPGLSADDPGRRDKAEDEVAAFWRRHWRGLRSEHADELFRLAKTAAETHVETAYQLLHEVLREDPRHEAAARAVGYDGGAGPSPAGEIQASRLRPNAALGLGAGWRIRSRHFEILTDAGQPQGRELARQIEAVHSAWSQLFYSFWNDADALRRRLESGRGAAPRSARRHRVVLYGDRRGYLAALQRKEPRIELTIGIYLPDDETSYFYWDDDPPRGTWRHEVTHQLFSESRRVASNAGLRQNFWILEGIAMYMESVVPHDGYCHVGGPGVDRLQYARYRQAPRSAEALVELVQMGRDAMQHSERLSELYSEAAGLCCFLMDSDGGQRRGSCLEIVQRVYQDRDDPADLFRFTELQPDQLLRRYHVFLADVDDRDMATLGPVRNLCLRTTRVTDAGLRQLDVSRLRWLGLTGVPVGDEALIAALSEARRLEQLTLEATKAGDPLFVSDDSLSARWPMLTELDLSRTRIGDATLRRLGELAQLEVLWLTATPITDACVDDLLALKELKILEVGGTALSDAALQRLRRGLPKLQRLGR